MDRSFLCAVVEVDAEIEHVLPLPGPRAVCSVLWGL